MASINLLGRSRRGRSTACKTAKGKLRKGWRYGRGGRCIRAKSRR